MGGAIPREVKLADWGRQTVAFAMMHRAASLGKPLDTDAQQMAVTKMTGQIAQDLWDEAFKELPQPVEFHAMLVAYSSKVLDWAEKQRKGKD